MLMLTLSAPLAAEASSLVERLRRSVVVIHSYHGQGSGIIWDGGGLIITNDHVVGRRHVQVELADGRCLDAVVVARDPRRDLAALRVHAHHLHPAPIGDSRALRVGELILAVGNPLGVRGSASLGIVSAPGNGKGRGGSELLQADLFLAPGNSGGPLVNMAGAVVGIASMIASPGIAIAIPSHVAAHFVDRV